MINGIASDDLFEDGRNPYLAPLAAALDTETLITRLEYSPLTRIDVKRLTNQQRLDLLASLQREQFEPTSSSLDIGRRILRMIRRGYLARDPCKPHVRKKTMAIARFAGEAIDKLPWLPESAMGMNIKGITGLGKTYEARRVLSLIPQRIDHSRNIEAGWEYLRQAVWLYVGMSHDGSLGGLLVQILVALDDALGTSYSSDPSLLRLSNEKLAVRIGILLRLHAVGVLVIDEIQERNLTSGARGGSLAVTFFLRVLNFGIPLLLIGNPMGMDRLGGFVQDIRRLSEGGSLEVHPAEPDDFDWGHCIAPSYWRYDVMPEGTRISDPDGRILYHYSGGFRSYAARVRCKSQELALDLGSAFVDQSHMDLAFNGSDFDERERDLIRGFRDKNPVLLMQFADIPWRQYAILWGRIDLPTSTNDALLEGKKCLSDESPCRDATERAMITGESEIRGDEPVLKRIGESIRRSRTRKANEAARQAEIRKDLSPEDMRNRGLQEYLIEGFESLKRPNSAD